MANNRNFNIPNEVSRLRLNPFAGYDGNQATYLAIAVLGSFVLNLLSVLSLPFIKKITVVNIAFESETTTAWMNLGGWGWCISGFEGVADQCSVLRRPVGGTMWHTLLELPESLHPIISIDNAVPKSYLAGSDAMHLLGTIVSWFTLLWALAASGEWSQQRPTAWNWTRQAFILSSFSGLIGFVSIFLTAGMIINIQKKIIAPLGYEARVTPGLAQSSRPIVFLQLGSVILTGLGLCIRHAIGKKETRPQWSIKGARNFNDPYPAPLSAALPPHDDHPPTWASLNMPKSQLEDVVIEKETLNTPEEIQNHDMTALARQYHKPGRQLI